MERSFKQEVKSLRLGEGDVFYGEGILAVTKALLQSGVSYISGYPGAPVSHLIDVLNDAPEILEELGIHFATAASEAGAAAMLGASIQYPIRGAAIWKSVVGTNVAADALSHLASSGVTGGALVIIGEDYGEGASIIQERSYAFAMKSQMWLLDPRPNLQQIVDTIEHGFAMSEASSTPVMLQLRIRACHMQGSFVCKNNRMAEKSAYDPALDANRFALPPWTYVQEKQKVDVRWPAALDYIVKHKLNEQFAGDQGNVGIVVQGGLYNGLLRSLQRLGLADGFGDSRIPLYVLNVIYPLVPSEVLNFCAGKKSILVVEEGQPNYIEQAIKSMLADQSSTSTKVHGKDSLVLAGEYTGEVLIEGLSRFLKAASVDAQIEERASALIGEMALAKARAIELIGKPVPARPPGFCVGCPERPVFSAIKIAEKTIGKMHVAGDVGCHVFAAMPPFNVGNTMLGYGLGLASSAAVAPHVKQPVINIMGDGGFWHNGLTSGITSAVANKDDGILIVMKNGYAAATGGQELPTSPSKASQPQAPTIDAALRMVGVRWLKTIRSYSVATMARAIVEAATAKTRGLKVIIAEGECQLQRQRVVKPAFQKKVAAGKRAVRTRFGIDPDVCTGDHSCIRLSGCPSLTIAPNPDPLRTDPIAQVDNNCVGCGLCGEVAHAAVLCPSFYRAEIIYNPTLLDRVKERVRSAIIHALAPKLDEGAVSK